MKITQYALLAAAFAMPAAASAATIVVNATGTVANTTTNSFTIGSDTYNTGELILNSITPFTVAQGDQILLQVTLDGAFVVPASGEQLFGINFFNFATTPYGSPTGNVTNTGTVAFSLMGGPTNRTGGDIAGGACSNCLTAITGAIPGAAFGFDALGLDETITALDQPFTIDTITISYQLRDIAIAVPEPATWAFLIMGFGGVASAMRVRRRAAAVAIA